MGYISMHGIIRKFCTPMVVFPIFPVSHHWKIFDVITDLQTKHCKISFGWLADVEKQQF